MMKKQGEELGFARIIYPSIVGRRRGSSNYGFLFIFFWRALPIIVPADLQSYVFGMKMIPGASNLQR